MKWKLIKARQGDEDDEQQMSAAKTKKKKKTTSSNSSPSSSSSSSSFSISHLLPLSWLASRLRTTKRSTTAHYRSTTNVCPSTSSPPPSPALPRRPPEPNSGHPSSAHLVFCHASVFPPARLAPRVAATPEVPDRRSHDDEGASRPRGAADARAVSRRRRRHHRSVGDLDLTLGHLIPFSVRSRAMYSDSGIDGSASGRQCRRRRRESHKARPPSETDNRDGALRRRSFGDRMRRRRAGAKVRVVSPRTPKPPVAAAATRRRRRGEEAAKATRELEGFAVVKRSQDPQRDFRESMVEMIWEKGIGRPEELESLLACYLFLNAHEHHDVIVKVFRQLWFELDPDRFACCYH